MMNDTSQGHSLGNLLLEHNVRPSYQRLKIMEYLAGKRHHPTADEIYRALCDDIPTLSKTTVYNTLALFVRTNLARRIVVEDNEAHYDAVVDDHGHFRCDSCGIIFDFTIGFESTMEEGLASFDVREKHVYYQGLCPNCHTKGMVSPSLHDGCTPEKTPEGEH